MAAEAFILQREADFLRSGVNGYEELLLDCQNREERNGSMLVSPSTCVNPPTISDELLLTIEQQQALLLDRLMNIRFQREQVAARRLIINQRKREADMLFDLTVQQFNGLSFHVNARTDQLDSIHTYLSNSVPLLQKNLHINPINDSFYIWFSGPFATINNFRLGKLPTHQVDWPEINAALGQVALCVATIASRAGITFKQFILIPYGSFAKVVKSDDRQKSQFNLFTDGSFSLFPKRNFNSALAGLLCCIHELGEHVMHQDPTLQIPYAILASEGKIHGYPISLGTDEEQWTRALKFMLSDIKWIVAWSTKHLPHI